MKQQNQTNQKRCEIQEETQVETQHKAQNHGASSVSVLTSNVPHSAGTLQQQHKPFLVSENQHDSSLDREAQDSLSTRTNHCSAISLFLEHNDRATAVGITVPTTAKHNNEEESQNIGTATLQEDLGARCGAQMSLWAYEISDTNLTLAEKFEKRKWESKSGCT